MEAWRAAIGPDERRSGEIYQIYYRNFAESIRHVQFVGSGASGFNRTGALRNYSNIGPIKT
jgi:hypothetical protein